MSYSVGAHLLRDLQICAFERFWANIAIAFLLGWSQQTGWLPECPEPFDDGTDHRYLLKKTWGQYH